MSEPRSWTIRECEIGGDLRVGRCHIDGSCTGGCNVASHHCDCEPIEVVEASPPEKRLTKDQARAVVDLIVDRRDPPIDHIRGAYEWLRTYIEEKSDA